MPIAHSPSHRSHTESDPRAAAALTPSYASGHPVTIVPRARVQEEATLDQRLVPRPDPVVVGGRELVVIAGPCSVEGAVMMHGVALAVARHGAAMLRGGAYKPRTSPHSFQGLGEEGLDHLAAARAASGLPIVSEVVDPRHVARMAEMVDVLQIGARNMQNYSLLAEVGRTRTPVLLKRGLSATISELLHAAEHIRVQGNEQVILCERGIRTFETATRNTLDVSAIPVLKGESGLPVIVDPSHAGGRAALVTPLALAAIAAGADGLIVEVHPDPASAWSDGEQTLDVDAFARMMERAALVAAAVGRTVRIPASREAEGADTHERRQVA